ncbi:hypothetical protein SK3146_02186 [Paenibacillus konkukensis]|uniref:Uncharacterized protein n=2 Tax=Paenibacillus konkukensis TaxID=2020716 RepID=A0ABY4RKI7_9BACL|nr:hypothetical protein SK3146_02186 [Paenibacillus konkukensis]
MFSILKYPPIGYLATDLDEYEGLHELTQYCGSRMDDKAEIPFRLDMIHPEYWPEAGEDNFVMGEKVWGLECLPDPVANESSI